MNPSFEQYFIEQSFLFQERMRREEREYYERLRREHDERNERFERDEQTEEDELFRILEDDKIIASGRRARIRIRLDIGRKHPRSEERIIEDNRLISSAETIISNRRERNRLGMIDELARREARREERKLAKVQQIKPKIIVLTKAAMEVVCEVCPICMDKPSKINSITTECGHEFCKGCYNEYIATANSNKSCPMCRKNDPKITVYRRARATKQCNL